MIRLPLIIIGKIICFVSRFLNIGNGGTWPGELVLRYKKNILTDFVSQLRQGCILVVGTNGKTTTSLMIKKILEVDGQKVLHNESGANLTNGIVSTFIKNSSLFGKINADWGVFEVDENSLPVILRKCHSGLRAGIHQKEIGSRVKPEMTRQVIIVFLNLFRDQLDRYGEVDVIAQKWRNSLEKIPQRTKIILNADDPLIAYLGKSVSSTPGVEARYFGLDDPKLFLENIEHATDSIFCLNCGGRLSYEGIYYSHIGIWKCNFCKDKRPSIDINNWQWTLPGVYNRYNTLAAVSVVKALGVKDGQIKKALHNFSPAFGRQEEFIIKGRKVKIFLAKNPAGFNESLRTVIAMGAKEILFVLNDRIPDGLDVSWIWDVDFEMLPDNISVIVSGDRIYDLTVRIKYSQNFENQKSKIKNQKYKSKIKSLENLEEAINYGIKQIEIGDTFYILPTYSAMLEVRKVLKGRKIL